jgi:hypothetical protein
MFEIGPVECFDGFLAASSRAVERGGTQFRASDDTPRSLEFQWLLNANKISIF